MNPAVSSPARSRGSRYPETRVTLHAVASLARTRPVAVRSSPSRRSLAPGHQRQRVSLAGPTLPQHSACAAETGAVPPTLSREQAMNKSLVVSLLFLTGGAVLAGAAVLSATRG